MLKNLFKRPPIDEFAKSLAEDIAKRYPPALEGQEGKRPSVNRLTRIIEDVCAKALAFKEEQSLGWLAKAKLGNSFRWQLTEMGYKKDFVEFSTEAVIVHLSRGKDKDKDSAAT